MSEAVIVSQSRQIVASERSYNGIAHAVSIIQRQQVHIYRSTAGITGQIRKQSKLFTGIQRSALMLRGTFTAIAKTANAIRLTVNTISQIATAVNSFYLAALGTAKVVGSLIKNLIPVRKNTEETAEQFEEIQHEIADIAPDVKTLADRFDELRASIEGIQRRLNGIGRTLLAMTAYQIVKDSFRSMLDVTEMVSLRMTNLIPPKTSSQIEQLARATDRIKDAIAAAFASLLKNTPILAYMKSAADHTTKQILYIKGIIDTFGPAISKVLEDIKNRIANILNPANFTANMESVKKALMSAFQTVADFVVPIWDAAVVQVQTAVLTAANAVFRFISDAMNAFLAGGFGALDQRINAVMAEFINITKLSKDISALFDYIGVAIGWIQTQTEPLFEWLFANVQGVFGEVEGGNYSLLGTITSLFSTIKLGFSTTIGMTVGFFTELLAYLSTATIAGKEIWSFISNIFKILFNLSSVISGLIKIIATGLAPVAWAILKIVNFIIEAINESLELIKWGINLLGKWISKAGKALGIVKEVNEEVDKRQADANKEERKNNPAPAAPQFKLPEFKIPEFKPVQFKLPEGQNQQNKTLKDKLGGLFDSATSKGQNVISNISDAAKNLKGIVKPETIENVKKQARVGIGEGAASFSARNAVSAAQSMTQKQYNAIVDIKKQITSIIARQTESVQNAVTGKNKSKVTL